MKKILLGFAMLLGTTAFAQGPTLGLVASYPFTNNSKDVSGNNYHGNNYGAALTYDRFGDMNSAYNFSTPGFIDFGNIFNNVFASTTKKFSISFWVKPAGYNQSNIIIAKHADAGCSANERQFFIRQFNNRINVEYFGNNAGTAGRFICGTTQLSDTSKWYHVVVTYNGNINTNDGLDRVGIFINNQADNTSLSCRSQSGSFPFDLTQGPARFAVGNYLNNSGTPCLTSTNYNGKIDDIKIYDRILTNSDVTQLFFEPRMAGTTGINSYAEKTDINIFPNPTNSLVTISFGNQAILKGYSVKITNAIGQIVYTAPVNQQSLELSTTNWTGKGIYFVHTMNERGSIICVNKLLVE